MRIAIDIDSTLHHYWNLLEEVAQRRFGVAIPYAEQVVWEIDRLKPEQLSAAVRETHSERLILESEPYPGAVAAVRRWHEAGHFIHITSHRAGDAHEATAQWLERIGLPYDELYCSYDKVSRCEEIGIDLLRVGDLDAETALRDLLQQVPVVVEGGVDVDGDAHRRGWVR